MDSQVPPSPIFVKAVNNGHGLRIRVFSTGSAQISIEALFRKQAPFLITEALMDWSVLFAALNSPRKLHDFPQECTLRRIVVDPPNMKWGSSVYKYKKTVRMFFEPNSGADLLVVRFADLKKALIQLEP